MTKRRMPKVVPHGNRLHKVLIQPQGPGNGPSDFRDFQGMCEPRPEVVAGRSQKYLCLMLQPPERLAVNNAVSVPLKAASDSTLLLRSHPAAR